MATGNLRIHSSAPLPFQGQKRKFARKFADVIRAYPDGTTFVDLFGGSGLLSHIARRTHPASRVIYNDFDNFSRRIAAIPRTNRILDAIRPAVSGIPRHKMIAGSARDKVIEIIREEELQSGYVDYITVSSSLVFSMNYATSLEQLAKTTLYNNVRNTGYAPADDYLAGIEIVSCDYRNLVDRFAGLPGVVFIVDPPYLSTDVSSYAPTMRWSLVDYLDILTVLDGHNFVYFSSDKSGIGELCEWLGRNSRIGNPFQKCRKAEIKTNMNFNSRYTDQMFYTVQ